MSDIRHIVFDIGNVLVRWDRERAYRTLIPDPEERRRFLAEICSMEWHAALDAGCPVDEAIEALVARHGAHAPLIRAYRERWVETIPGPVPGTVEILEALLDAGRDVTALTNFNQDLFAVTVEAYPFLGRFRGVTVSGTERMVKPDPAIYARHAELWDLDPAAILFFDDSAPNVAAAREAGWQAELFTDAAGMRRDLARHGAGLEPVRESVASPDKVLSRDSRRV